MPRLASHNMQKMNRFLAASLVSSLAFISAGTKAQTDTINQQSVVTHVPVDARFEIVQSELAVRWTFKLDKFTGNVFQLVATKSGDLAWEEMPRFKSRVPDPVTPGRPNYQIFMSGIMAKNMFLMNVNSGATWQLQKGSDDTVGWVPFE
ncbi:hypothetical protein [Paraburkholderia pallida]|uniref:Uncharacterized protein n=1 Tax=Paraburkholderia pallida TaxID=2547399 RepID=A0A4P7D1H7_9BURK|nr:hypothetical protein [Paraburkholderia pallida]QBR00495.1 hypothetical protein E1956_26030 [Paraburkholderia pallida]